MSDFSTLRTENLRSLISETENALADLKGELERREEVAQEREIEKLDEHLKNAELSLQTIKDFFQYLLDDFRSDKVDKKAS